MITTSASTANPKPVPPTCATGEPPARFRDLLRAEWIKLWSLRSTYAVLGLGAVAMIVLNVNGAIADYNNWPSYSPMQKAHFNPLHDAFSHSSYLLLVLAAGSIGAVSVVGEYASGLIRTTFAAVPLRREVMAAKVILVAASMTAVGTLIAVCSFTVTQAILAGRHIGWSIGHPGAFRALAASALIAPVSALIGMGVGALIRHTATSIVAVIVVLDLLPQFFVSQRHYWVAVTANALPLNAWSRLVDPSYAGYRYPATITGSWVVYAVWPLVAVVLTMIVVDRVDA